MKVLITGSNGFIGRNIIAELNSRGAFNVLEYSKDSKPALLDEYCSEAQFVLHLAGVNRPQDPSEFMDGNYGLTSTLLEALKKHNNNCPVLISSSTQAELDNPYGLSKKASEDLLFQHRKETGAEVYVYRLPNVFGKWCKPNYNSAVATFCYNIARDFPITVTNNSANLNLVYIDDVINEFIFAIAGRPNRIGDYCSIPEVNSTSLGELVDLIYSFRHSREERTIPNMLNPLAKKLYSTYLSYLPEDQFSYPLKMNVDDRGSFTEFIKTPDRGQVSVNISKPGIIKGNHWHHTKNEKFLVVSGRGVIRFRKLNTDEVISYYVNGDKLEVVDIPVGYTHNIENLGSTDMVTIMWANEYYDPGKPDTYFLGV